jgi:hypothetical protein
VGCPNERRSIQRFSGKDGTAPELPRAIAIRLGRRDQVMVGLLARWMFGEIDSPRGYFCRHPLL